MPTPILATKLYIPLLRPNVVSRPRLIERLNEGLHCKLTLLSAPAGFGKTTLVSQWLAGCQRPIAWLSLDEGDNDPVRFLSYLIAALKTIAANTGEMVSGMLQSPQPPRPEAILTALLNDIATISDHFILVLDDYHVLEAREVDHALTFLLDHLPPQMHLVIATREDPSLPLARLRAGGQLTELRVTDLRFTNSEASEFLNKIMNLHLPAQDIATLENRAEGWIAGLQLAAISLQGQEDTSSFITSFSGSHHFVVDYLLEEVLQRKAENVQKFLLRTSILDRLCGPLCDALLLDSSVFGQETLEYLERANLFIVPLDNERCWYRYHHLFRDLLRQRLQQSTATAPEGDECNMDELHRRASAWFEENGLETEAFQHAAATHDVGRTERLIEGKGMPLHFRGAVVPVLNWLKSLPTTALDSYPSLWTAYASVLLASGQTNGAEQKLQAAERVLQDAEINDKNRDLIGRIAAIRATAAASQQQVEIIIAQSRRALEYLHPNNLAFRTSTAWKLGFAYQLQGDRAAASRAYSEVISTGEESGNTMFTIMATTCLGMLQEADNRLHQAVATYRRVLHLTGKLPLPLAYEAHLGLARVFYEWNDLGAAEQHGQQSIQLARQIENNERFVTCELLLARLKLARGDVVGATAILAEASEFAHQHSFMHLLSEIAPVEVLILLRQGKLAAAAQSGLAHKLAISQARVHLALGDTSVALAVLSSWGQKMEAKRWEDERLKVMILQAVALQAHGDRDRAVQLLVDALALAEPGGFVRLFVDEGSPMVRLLSEVVVRGIMPEYSGRLLAVCKAEEHQHEDTAHLLPPAQPLIESLSQRELEVLRLIAQGLSNNEICERLFLALDTVKGHNRRIFDKLQVQRRTEAVARARELGLL